jgi:hypothetical protein
VVVEHLKLLMVNYIGGKIIKIMLDLYRLFVVYLGIRDEK